MLLGLNSNGTACVAAVDESESENSSDDGDGASETDGSDGEANNSDVTPLLPT
jgi:hypothetical protein